jgi:hypothetical protein
MKIFQGITEKAYDPTREMRMSDYFIKTRQPNPRPNAAISGGLSGGQPAAALPIGRPVTGYSYRNKSGPSTVPSKCCVNRNRSFPLGGYQLTFAPETTR